MSDFLLEVSRNPTARSVVNSLGLPLPMPEDLARSEQPSVERPLEKSRILFAGHGDLTPPIATALARAGGAARVLDDASAKIFAEAGEAYGLKPTSLDGADENKERFDALVFDASGLATPADLDALHSFFQPWIGRLGRSGRVLLIGRPVEEAADAAAAATQAALEGFMRSLAKEIGRKGATANLLRVAAGGEERLEGPLRFLLSPASAFVSAQAINVSGSALSRPVQTWSRPLAGKVALITGAARGIGAATAELMAAEGAHVICLDRPGDDEPLAEIARKVGGSMLVADVTADDAADKIVKEVEERHGGLDIVVFNAGITRDKILGKMDDARWQSTLAVNLISVEKIATRLLEGTLRNGGRIVCLSSIAGIAGNAGQTNYAASKAGIIGLVRRLSRDVADRGITVNAIAPGFIETRLTAAIPVMIREVGRRLSALGQGGLPSDVGQAITFLSTPGANGLTGSVLRVCGGAFLGA